MINEIAVNGPLSPVLEIHVMKLLLLKCIDSSLVAKVIAFILSLSASFILTKGIGIIFP